MQVHEVSLYDLHNFLPDNTKVTELQQIVKCDRRLCLVLK
jgi:hypothetical protein